MDLTSTLSLVAELAAMLVAGGLAAALVGRNRAARRSEVYVPVERRRRIR